MGWLKEHTTGYTAGVMVLAGSSLITALLVLTARVHQTEEARA
jgi:hypothetical protein